MTITLKTHTENNINISLRFDKSNIYCVEACQVFNDNMCGYPFQKMTYTINELSKAKATFNRYIKKYCKGV